MAKFGTRNTTTNATMKNRSFEDFSSFIEKRVKKFMEKSDPTMIVEIHNCIRSNDNQYTGLSIREEDQRVSPVVNLDNY